MAFAAFALGLTAVAAYILISVKKGSPKLTLTLKIAASALVSATAVFAILDSGVLSAQIWLAILFYAFISVTFLFFIAGDTILEITKNLVSSEKLTVDKDVRCKMEDGRCEDVDLDKREEIKDKRDGINIIRQMRNEENEANCGININNTNHLPSSILHLTSNSHLPSSILHLPSNNPSHLPSNILLPVSLILIALASAMYVVTFMSIGLAEPKWWVFTFAPFVAALEYIVLRFKFKCDFKGCHAIILIYFTAISLTVLMALEMLIWGATFHPTYTPAFHIMVFVGASLVATSGGYLCKTLFSDKNHKPHIVLRYLTYYAGQFLIALSFLFL